MSNNETASWGAFFSVLADGADCAGEVLLSMTAVPRTSALSAREAPLLRLSASLELAPDPAGSGVICWRIQGPKPDSEMLLRTDLSDVHAQTEALLACPGDEPRALEIVAFALAAACRGETAALWRLHDFGHASPPVLADMEQRLNGFRMLSRDEEVEEHLRQERDVLLYGNVGVGKTTTATHQALQYAADDESGLVWLDLSDPHDSDESVALALLKMGHRKQILLVIDDVQANVSAARAAFDLVVQLRRNLGLPIVVLATGSPVTNEIEPPLCSTRLEPVLADGYALVRSILNSDDSLDDGARADITKLADGDAFLAGIALRLWRDSRRVPDRDEFADLVVSQVGAIELRPEARRLLYEMACLSACDIQVSKRQVALLPPERTALPELMDAKLIQFNDDSYSIRHRSLARLLVLYGLRNWVGAEPLPMPAIFAYDYLQRAGAAQIKATLDKLDLLPLDREPSQRPTASIASAWRALGFLGDSLAYAVERDPGWNDSVASAAFAGMALAKLGRRRAWERCAEFVRGRWSYEHEYEPPLWVGDPSADLKAFVSMRELVTAQRQGAAATETHGDASLGVIDAERACRTWMLGVLISFEALSPDREVGRLDRLCRIASNLIDGGAFYPRGAPWVTAQIVQGLCIAGHSYQSNLTVRRACDWLCEDRRLGGAYQSGWQNIVSVSTFDAMTTSLCYLALWQARCPNSQLLEIAYEKLLAEQNDLMTSPRHETELALIVESRLRHDDRWKDLSGPILQLLGWVRREQWLSREVNATQLGDPISASAKAPFIAAQLWIIIWAAAKQELPNLLRDALQIDTHVSPVGPWPPTDPSRRGTASQAYAPKDPAATIAGAEERKRQRLRQRIDDQLNDLATTSRTLRLASAKDAASRDIGHWREIRNRLDAIEAEFDSGSASHSTLTRLDDLGREIFGETW